MALKGDLPIGVSPTSVETWVHPEWFHLGTQTGAPPDDFATDGQNWGFPIYDWARMAEDGFGWWRHRLQALARTFDVYRIDHVLGFFRIWEIPEGATAGLLGRFRPCLPLSDAEVRGWLDDVDLDPLTTPAGEATDVALLAVPGGWHPRIQWWTTTAYRAWRPTCAATSTTWPTTSTRSVTSTCGGGADASPCPGSSAPRPCAGPTPMPSRSTCRQIATTAGSTGSI